jgi:site-specific DNA recombinase
MRAAIYARVSTTRQAETDLSIPDQIAQVEAYCQRSGYVVVNIYGEPGASATDDKRPEFQKLMADAMLDPSPFDAIIVHSYSRFFRDAFELEFNYRRLAKRGVKLIAITQELSDDPMGKMMRQIVALFDEYQSKENGKHTSRAMKENARRGNHNSRPIYGYRLVGTGEIGNKGREKKRLAIEPAEAEVIRRIYDLYANGLDGTEMGMSSIAAHLNARGILRKGRPWRTQTVEQALSHPVYMGEYVYNKTSGKDRRPNPEAEHVRYAVPAIVESAIFRMVEGRRRARRPSAAPARRLTSPHLLSGLLKCGCCGSGMVVSTGTSKGGKVHGYYTCQKKLSQGSKACPSRRVPLPVLERLVLSTFAEHVLAPERLQAILAELEKGLSEGNAGSQERVRDLQRRLKEKDQALATLMEAIEKRILPLDETTRQRAQAHQNARLEVLGEIGRLRATQGMKIDLRSPRQVRAFGQAARNRLFDTKSGFGKSYLNALVTDITVSAEGIVMRGSSETLAAAIGATNPPEGGVRSSMRAWRPHGDSNPGYRRESAILQSRAVQHHPPR